MNSRRMVHHYPWSLLVCDTFSAVPGITYTTSSEHFNLFCVFFYIFKVGVLLFGELSMLIQVTHLKECSVYNKCSQMWDSWTKKWKKPLVGSFHEQHIQYMLIDLNSVECCLHPAHCQVMVSGAHSQLPNPEIMSGRKQHLQFLCCMDTFLKEGKTPWKTLWNTDHFPPLIQRLAPCWANVYLGSCWG